MQEQARFLEMLGQSDTMETLEYLKGPLQDVSAGDAIGIKRLTGQMIRGKVFDSEPARWRARLQVFEEISSNVEPRFTQPRNDLVQLLPL